MNHVEFSSDQAILDLACEEAQQSSASGGIGAGAVLVKGNALVASSRDRSIELNDPIAVPEMDCIRRAGRRSDQAELSLYTTRYPDMLTAGTILQFSIGELVIGQEEAGSGALDLLKSRNIPVRFIRHAGCDHLQA